MYPSMLQYYFILSKRICSDVMIPPKLKRGDTVAVIAPASSLAIIGKEERRIAVGRLSELGFNVVFSKHAEELDEFRSSSIKSRLEDLEWAFGNKKIKAIFTVLGGFNTNQLLKQINYKLIKKNPKIFCGFSDITALHNAILTKTGLVTYSGPHFASFGMEKGFEYTLEYFKRALISNSPFNVMPSSTWSDDMWFKDQNDRTFIKNKGYLIINVGSAKGSIIGGNLCTFNLLHGTEFMPDLKEKVLFLEDDYETHPLTFDRNLQSIIQQPGFEKIKGIIIGRFQKTSKMSGPILKKIIKNKKELDHIPVIAEVDFGHTTPQITFPIGGRVELVAKKNKVTLKITKH